jgi:hypothetical protein
MSHRGRLVVFAASGLSLSILGSACLFRDSDRESYEPELECTVDADCSHLDDGDNCYAPPRCESNRCQRLFLQDDTDCQCTFGPHCEALGYEQHACNVVTCDANHQCGEAIAPEGPAPPSEQDQGDCATRVCDGISLEGVSQSDPSDLPDDYDSCTVDLCTEDGPENAVVADGDYCSGGDSGRCYAGQCYAGCATDDDEVCGDEGADEPKNDDGVTATDYPEGLDVCGMLDGDDIDWLEMHLVDDDFVTDILHVEVHASAPAIEICAYALCNNFTDPNGGYPDGACAEKLPGPFGSLGCCWQGAPESLSPSWDLDCSGTSDDGGTMFFSLRAPGGDACETFVFSARY